MASPVTRLIIETEDRGASGTIQRIARELTGMGNAASAAGSSGSAGADALSASLRRATQEMAGVATGYRSVQVAGKASMRDISEEASALSRVLGGMDAGLILGTGGGILALVDGVRRAASSLKDATLSAARYEVLGVSMEAVGRNAQYSANELHKQEAALRQSGIAGNEARESIARMIQAQIDLSNATKLGRIAQDAAVVGNVNSSEAFQKLVYGIQSAQVDVLRTIGINVSFEQSYKQLASQLGVTVDSLTEQQKVQARLNAVLEQGERLAGTYEAAMEKAGKKLTSLARYHQDLANETGRIFTPALNAGVDLYTDYITDLTAGVKGLANAFEALLLVSGGRMSFKDFMFSNRDDIQKVLDNQNTVQGLQSQIAQLQKSQRGAIYSDEKERYQKEIDKLLAQLMAVRADEAAASVRGTTDFMAQRQAGMSDASGRMRKMQEYADDNEVKRQKQLEQEREQAARKAEQLAKQRMSATQSITRDLEQMNDTGTEGAGRIAALQKKMDDYAETLGKTNPKVKEYGDLIAYANQHNGFTPQQVAASTRAIEKETEALQDRADAIRQSTRADGTLDQSRLALLTAQSAARREYNQDLLKGVSEETAAAKRDLAMKAAQANAVQQDLAVRESFYSMLAGMYRNDEGLQRRLLDKQVENYRAAGVAEVDIARWKARRELEIATDAASGMKLALSDYYDGVSNMARVSGDATTTVVQGFETGIAGMLRNSESAWQNWQNTVLDVLANVAAKMLMLQAMNALGLGESGGGSGMALGLGGAILNGIAGMFSPGGAAAAGATTLSNGAVVNASGVVWGMHDGGTVGRDATFSREVPMSLFAGARRYHGGGPVLSPGEVPIIAQTGERVQSRGEVAAMTASGGSILRALAEIREAVARQNWTNVNVTDKSLIYEAMATPQGRKIMLNHVGAAPTEFRSALS